MGEKKKKAEKVRDHEPSVDPAVDQSGGGSRADSLIGSRKIAAVFLFLISFLVFFPSLNNDFVWDDVSYIVNKTSFLDFSRIDSQFFPNKAKRGKKAGKYFRPVYQISLIMDNEIWKTSSFGFHLTNVLLHAVCTVLLYFMVLMLLGELNVSGRESVAFLSGVLFALYPMHVESVSFVSARGDILAAIFFFLSFMCYLRSYKKLYYLFIAAAFFFLSILSKEVAIVLPAVILGFDLIAGRLKTRANLIKYAILALIALIYFFVRSKSYIAISELVGGLRTGTFSGLLEIWEIFLNTYLHYIVQLVFPYNLNPFHDGMPDAGILGLIFSFVLLIALCAVAGVSIRKKENVTAFSIIWVLATLLPAAAVAVLSLALTIVSDRFLYIPSVGVCLLLAYVFVETAKRFKLQWISLVLTAIVALSFAVVTVNAQKIWENNLSLWKYAVEKSPDALPAKINYADALRGAGEPYDALKQYQGVYEDEGFSELNLRTRIITTHGIAISYIDLANFRNAEKWLDVTLDYTERYLPMYYYLKGFISLKKNNPESAERYLKQSSEKGPSADAYYLLGGVYFIKAERDKSVEMYGKAEQYLNDSLKLKPRFSEAHILLAKTYLALGDKAKARAHAQSALEYADSEQVADEAKSILKK